MPVDLPSIDLTAYIGRGFPDDYDRLIATVDVAGMDLTQVQSAVRLCPATEPVLYGAQFSPRRIRYRVGARPALEQIARIFSGSVDRKAEAAMQ
jgi:hypothetical protein